jgi:hypothetical protein
MRTPLLLLSSLFVAFAGCASAPTTDSTAPWAPMPMGEVASTSMQLEARSEFEIEHNWTDTAGRQWNIAFRCKYTADNQRELLAEACMQEQALAVHEQSLPICKAADLDTIDGIAACEERLQRALTDLVFPCIDGVAVARVSGIEWTLWHVR